jgi:hypothetical protein
MAATERREALARGHLWTEVIGVFKAEVKSASK